MAVPTSTDSKKPLVTVCMTAYRRPTMMLQALHACAAQDYRPLEIDISDDSPNTFTEETVRSFKMTEGISLRYRRNVPSLGEPQNVNSLFLNARGKYLILMHDDDLLLPGAVTALVEAMLSSPVAVAAFGVQEVIRNSGEVSVEESEKMNALYRRDPKFSGLLEDPFLCGLRHQFPSNGYIVEAEAARKVGYRSHKEAGRAGDTDFGIRLGQTYKERAFAFIPRRISQYRLTLGSSRTQVGIGWKLYDSLAAMRGLTPEQFEARNEMMCQLAPFALLDNAVYRNRREAFKIFLSKRYRSGASKIRRLYHLALIALPQIYSVRQYMGARLNRE